MKKIKELEKELQKYKDLYNQTWSERFDEGLKIGKASVREDMLKEIKNEIHEAFVRGDKNGWDRCIKIWEMSKIL